MPLIHQLAQKITQNIFHINKKILDKKYWKLKIPVDDNFLSLGAAKIDKKNKKNHSKSYQIKATGKLKLIPYHLSR